MHTRNWELQFCAFVSSGSSGHLQRSSCFNGQPVLACPWVFRVVFIDSSGVCLFGYINKQRFPALWR